MLLPEITGPHFQPRRLLNVPYICERMRKASRQQWNILELLYIAGPMPLLGKWREQRCARGLVRRQMVVVSERVTGGHILGVEFTSQALFEIHCTELGYVNS